MSCNGCGRPVDTPRPYHCPELHYPRQTPPAVHAPSHDDEHCVVRAAEVLSSDRIATLESAIREWIAANDAPARSGNRGETSVWLARTVDAENALRAVVDVDPKHPGATGLAQRAEQLEIEVGQLRVRASGRDRSVAANTDLTAALRALIARLRRTGGYATPEEQDALWRAEQVMGAVPAGVVARATSVPGSEFNPAGGDDRPEQGYEAASSRSGEPCDAPCGDLACGESGAWCKRGPAR